MLSRDLLDVLLHRDDDEIAELITTRSADGGFADILQQLIQFAVLAFAPDERSRAALASIESIFVISNELDDGTRVDQLVEVARMIADARRPWSEAPITNPPATTPADGETASLEAAVRERDRLAAERWIASHLASPELGRTFFAHAAQVDDGAHTGLRIAALVWRIARQIPREHRFAVLRTAAVEWTSGHQWVAIRQHDSDVDASSAATFLIDRYAAEEGSPFRLFDIEALDAALLARDEGSNEALARLDVRVRISSAMSASESVQQVGIAHSPRRDFGAALRAWAIAARRSDEWDPVALKRLKAVAAVAGRSGAWAEEEMN